MAIMQKAVIPCDPCRQAAHVSTPSSEYWQVTPVAKSCLRAELGQIAGAATSTGQQVVTGISSGAGNAVSGVESLASTAEATYTTIEGQTITAEQGDISAARPLCLLCSKQRARPAGKSGAE